MYAMRTYFFNIQPLKVLSSSRSFSLKGVRASLDGFERNIGCPWTRKRITYVTSVFNKEDLTKWADFFYFYRIIDNLNLSIVHCTV